MKVFTVSVLRGVLTDSPQQYDEFYVADSISKVIEKLSTDLLDENTEVLSIVRATPHAIILP